MTYSPSDRAYVIEWAGLISGTAAGLSLAVWLTTFGWSLPGELDRAREAGMVSLTTLAHYPKSRDQIAFALMIGLPVLGSWLGWGLVWRSASPLGRGMFADGLPPPSRRAWPLALFGLGLTGLASWHATYLTAPNWNPAVGAWPLLGEQGATLAWAQSIMAGGVYGRDFFALYGPMFVYPLAWLMELTGEHSAWMERVYKLGLDTVAVGLVGYVAAKTMRSRLLALVVIVLCWLLYPAQASPSANTTVLRWFLGVVPVFGVAYGLGVGQRRWIVLAGLALGQSVLFSQEAGLAAAASGMTVFLGWLWVDRATPGRVVGAFLLFVAATLVSLAPMTGYLVWHGGGPGLYDCLVGYPRTMMLGFGGKPFPTPVQWLGENFRAHWVHYSVIAVYAGTLIAMGIAWVRGVRSGRFFWMLGLVVYGLVLFRVALGRSEGGQTMKVLIPALLLTCSWVDDLWARLRSVPACRAQRPVLALVLLAVAGNFVGGVLFDPPVRRRMERAWECAVMWDGKLTARVAGHAVAEIPGLGVYVDPETAVALREIRSFLQANTDAREPVLFFPNEAAYYFLLDRPNPTRYAVTYFATTFDRQREVIRDLERARPRFVVVSRNTWRVDKIPENVQIPLIVDYLRAHYRLAQRLRTADILERN